MIIGIVGSEGAKFTTIGRMQARSVITSLVTRPDVEEVVSGECHLGGVDQWAHEIAVEMEKKFTGFPPATLSWENGYKPRNLKIANRSDEVVCITVKKLPDGFKGMTFKLCYHCGVNTHVKSGGCWTMKQAAKMGKKTSLVVIENT